MPNQTIMSTVKRFKLYIDGRWVDSVSKETFPSDNPAKPKQILGIFQKGNEEDANRAVDAARKTSEKWKETPAPKRGLILLNAARLLRKNKEKLAVEMTMEMGKVIAEARGDVQEAIDITEYMAGEGRRMLARAAIYTKDVNKAMEAIMRIEAGLTYVNSSTIGSEVHLPFGGTKHTGIGTREAGIEGINEFSDTKTVYIDYSGKLQKAQIDLD